MRKIKTHELRNRLLFTTLIFMIYMGGRSVLLFYVDSLLYESTVIDSQNIMMQMISGDRYQYTVFALGIMPYITSSLLVSLVMALVGSEVRSRISPQRTKRLTLFVLVLLSIALAVSRASDLIFRESILDEDILRGIAVVEMVVGALVVYKLADVNKEYGIAGQTPLFLVNILDGIIRTFQKHTIEELRIPLVLCGIYMMVIMVMENIIIRIPVQRVSIHNTYADKSYIGFKLNPIGVMPVMFSTAIFTLLQLIVGFLAKLFGDSTVLANNQNQLNFSSSLGVNTYLCIVLLFTVIFSFVMLSPGEMAEQLQKSGDSIVGVYAGKKTKWYLRRKLLILSMISGLTLSLLMGISLRISLRGEIASDLALLPATAMILTGLVYTIYQEIKTYWRFDSYRSFM